MLTLPKLEFYLPVNLFHAIRIRETYRKVSFARSPALSLTRQSRQLASCRPFVFMVLRIAFPATPFL
jgi:hypothetical protein